MGCGGLCLWFLIGFVFGGVRMKGLGVGFGGFCCVNFIVIVVFKM